MYIPQYESDGKPRVNMKLEYRVKPSQIANKKACLFIEKKSEMKKKELSVCLSNIIVSDNTTLCGIKQSSVEKMREEEHTHLHRLCISIPLNKVEKKGDVLEITESEEMDESRYIKIVSEFIGRIEGKGECTESKKRSDILLTAHRMNVETTDNIRMMKRMLFNFICNKEGKRECAQFSCSTRKLDIDNIKRTVNEYRDSVDRMLEYVITNTASTEVCERVEEMRERERQSQSK